MITNDIQTSPTSAESPRMSAQEPASSPVTGLTGLLDGFSYIRYAQERLRDMTPNWCIINIEISHHKLFTDWYGVDAGQELVMRVAAHLRRAAEETGGIPGYMGESSFCLAMPYDTDRIETLYEALRAEICGMGDIEGFLPVFGIAMLDGSSDDFRTYFNNAGLTIDEIQDDMHTRIRIYNKDLHRKNSREYKTLYAFRGALERGEICFFLQPQLSMPEKRIVGAEALARWRRPDGTMEQPGHFIPLLEKYGLITDLDMYLWESVCRWQKEWIDGGHTPLPISVNVSRIDLFSIDVPSYFEKLLSKYGLPTKYIKIEITESAYAEDADTVREIVSRLRGMGFMVLMDDFGSGYSSLNMLRSMQLDVIKLDARFLELEGENRRKGINILESVVNMTRSLTTPIIVEGVETTEQLAYLGNLGCRYMQGFYFHKPMPVADFEALIADERNIDTHGFVFKANEQLHVREFFDAAIFTDAMFNNILGPVAILCQSGLEVDIIRYNEQYFQVMGIDVGEMGRYRVDIQKNLHREDREKLLSILRRAESAGELGARGVVRTYRPNGVLVWLSLNVYFMNEDEQGKKFYASVRDVSDLQFISSEMPGGYFRCMPVMNEFEFLFLGRSFLKMVGYTAREIWDRFDNRLLNLVHPSDRDRVIRETQALEAGEIESLSPYRIRRKRGDYIYVAEQSHLTDSYGVPCWQGVLIDVTEMMHSRNQLRVLSRHMDISILVLVRDAAGLRWEVIIHGLQGVLGITAEAFESGLNDGSFCRWIAGYNEDIPHSDYTKMFAASAETKPKKMTVTLPDTNTVRLIADAERVEDDTSIEYIVYLRREN